MPLPDHPKHIRLAAFTLWRWLYFGQILPNTFYAKLDYGGALLAQCGADYVGRFLRSVWLLAAAAAATAAWVRSSPRWVGVFLALVEVF